jgi:hypothetical protein
MDYVNSRWTKGWNGSTGYDFTLEDETKIQFIELNHHSPNKESHICGFRNSDGSGFLFNSEQRAAFEDLKKTLAFGRPDDFKPCYIMIPKILLERK